MKQRLFSIGVCSLPATMGLLMVAAILNGCGGGSGTNPLDQLTPSEVRALAVAEFTLYGIESHLESANRYLFDEFGGIPECVDFSQQGSQRVYDFSNCMNQQGVIRVSVEGLRRDEGSTEYSKMSAQFENFRASSEDPLINGSILIEREDSFALPKQLVCDLTIRYPTGCTLRINAEHRHEVSGSEQRYEQRIDMTAPATGQFQRNSAIKYTSSCRYPIDGTAETTINQKRILVKYGVGCGKVIINGKVYDVERLFPDPGDDDEDDDSDDDDGDDDDGDYLDPCKP